MSKLAGRCGIYCGACVIHRIFKDKDLERAKIVAERFNCPPDLVKCNGCQNPELGDWSFGDNPDGSERCEIQKCLDSKGYDFCYQCPNLTECDLLRELNGRYEGVPYHNLKRLKEIRKEAWLEEQESMWKCPECGSPIDFFVENCRKCGADLRETRKENIERIKSF